MPEVIRGHQWSSEIIRGHQRNDSRRSHACGSLPAEQKASRSVLIVIVSGASPWRAICSSSSSPRSGRQHRHTCEDEGGAVLSTCMQGSRKAAPY
jgi:hypothetical protein